MSIEDEVGRMGPLRNVAGAIVDYARAVSARTSSDFEFSSGEWTLKPDNWINLKFTYLRSYRITISLGIHPMTLSPENYIQIKAGRFANWCKIQVENPEQLASAVRLIDDAFYSADNSFRKRNGWPKRPEKPKNILDDVLAGFVP